MHEIVSLFILVLHIVVRDTCEGLLCPPGAPITNSFSHLVNEFVFY